MRILITGASGFIGSNLISALLNQNHEVFAIVRSKEKIINYDWSNKVKFIIKDLNGFEKADLKNINPDLIYHLAWSNLPNYEDPVHIEKNLPEQISFLRMVAESGLKKIIVAGSCLEYGLKEGLLNEEDPLQPTTFYGLAKISVLSILKFFKHEFNLDFLWFRIFYVYGDNQNQRSLYPSLIRAIQNGESVFKMSHGNQMRDFIHINDVIKYFLYPLSNINMSGVFNISSGRSIKVKDFVNNIINSYGSDIKIEFDHYDVPSYEPMNFWGDNMKIKELEKLNNL